jgi:hypothetical protein
VDPILGPWRYVTIGGFPWVKAYYSQDHLRPGTKAHKAYQATLAGDQTQGSDAVSPTSPVGANNQPLVSPEAVPLFQQALRGSNIAAESLSSLAALAIAISPHTKPIQVVGLVAGTWAIITDLGDNNWSGAQANALPIALQAFNRWIPGFGSLPQEVREFIIEKVVAGLAIYSTSNTVSDLASDSKSNGRGDTR